MREQPQQRGQRRAARQPLARWRDEVKRPRALLVRQIAEEGVGVRVLEGEGHQPALTVADQQAGERPLAEAALAVVEDCPPRRRHRAVLRLLGHAPSSLTDSATSGPTRIRTWAPRIMRRGKDLQMA